LPDQGSSTVRGRRLAAELRRLRGRAGLTGDEVAQRLGWSGSKLSRIELHRTGVKEDDLVKLLDLYHVSKAHRQELVALARESSEKSRLEKATASFPAEVAAYVNAEAEAESVWNWEPQLVPGLLQTPDYARGVTRLWRGMFPGPPTETDRRVETRLLRQQVLVRDPPLELTVVMDQSVLRRRFGDSAAMRQQLERLAEASELPNIELRIYPLDSDHPPLATGAFSYMQFPHVHDVPLHDLVSVEHLEGNYYLEDEEQTYRYRVAFEYLVGQSLNPPQSRSLISATMRDVWA
jgi:transcriptional regulator with XRE-family HTH domain